MEMLSTRVDQHAVFHQKLVAAGSRDSWVLFNGFPMVFVYVLLRSVFKVAFLSRVFWEEGFGFGVPK